MSNLAKAKRLLAPGTVWDVTNHYIDRVDHPSFGTTRRTITRCVSGRTYCTVPNKAKDGYFDWPKAGQVEVDDDGTIRLLGSPMKDPAATFLTLRPVAPDA